MATILIPPPPPETLLNDVSRWFAHTFYCKVTVKIEHGSNEFEEMSFDYRIKPPIKE